MAKCGNCGSDMPKGKGDGEKVDITPGVKKNFRDFAQKTTKQFDTPPMKKLPKSK